MKTPNRRRTVVLLVILALFPALTWMRRRFAWSPVAHAVATSVIAILGLTWFFTRLVA